MKDIPLLQTVSINQAAQLLGVTRRTIYNYISAGLLETQRTLGGRQQVSVAALRADPRYRDVPYSPEAKWR